MTLMQIIKPTVALREMPGQVGRRDSQLYYGERFEVDRIERGQAYGRNLADDYEGWIASEALSPQLCTPTHRVTAQSAFVYPVATMKAMPVQHLPLGAFVTIDGEANNGYLPVRLLTQSIDRGWIFSKAITAIEDQKTDPVTEAEKLLGVPYLWGGRTAFGIDCSGLVQLSLSLCGIPCPRDADLQEAAFQANRIMDPAYQRGDIVYFPGHVGFMANAETMLHANAYSMTTAYEMLADFLTRTDLKQPNSVIRLIHSRS